MGKISLTKHIDIMVIYTFAIVFFLSASVFAYKITTREPCNEVVFEHHARKYRVGEIVSFEDKTLNAKRWSWNFGDSTNVGAKRNPIHIFKKPGEYKVELIINDVCSGFQLVIIENKLVIVDTLKFPKFTIPTSITVGEKLVVEDETKGAKSWEWRFGETTNANSKERKATYVYEEPGLKTVSLIVNGNLKYITKKQINVIPLRKESSKLKLAPEDNSDKIKYSPDKKIEVTPEKEIPFINEAEFKKMLMQVADKKITPKAFTEYFCGDINKKIVSNGKNSTFLEMCEKIRGKSIKIKNLNIYRVKKSNCIKTITIDYKKGWIKI